MTGSTRASCSARRRGWAARRRPAPCADRANGMVIDGPFAETKEQLLGLYVVNCADEDAAIGIARDLRRVNPSAVYEIRPIRLYLPGESLPETARGSGLRSGRKSLRIRKAQLRRARSRKHGRQCFARFGTTDRSELVHRVRMNMICLLPLRRLIAYEAGREYIGASCLQREQERIRCHNRSTAYAFDLDQAERLPQVSKSGCTLL